MSEKWIEPSDPIRRCYLWSVLCGLCLLLGFSSITWANTQASIALATVPGKSSFQIVDATGKVVLQGDTPYIGVLAAGRYRLVLKKAGFFQEQRSIKVSAGQQTIIRVELMKQSSTATPPATRAPVKPGATAPPPRQVAVPTPTRRVAPRVQPLKPEVRPVTRRVVVRPAPVRPAPTRPAPKATPGKKVASAPTKPGEKAKPKPRRIPWIPLAAAGGLAIAGAVFWGLADASLNDSKDKAKLQVEAYQAYQQARTNRSTSTFLFAAGGAALGLAALFYFWNPSKKKKGKRPPKSDHSTVVGFTQTFE